MTPVNNIRSTIALSLVSCLMVVALLHPTIPTTKIGVVDAFTIIIISPSNNFAIGNNQNVVRLYAASSSEEGNPEEGDDNQPYQGYNPFTGKYKSSASSSSTPWPSSSKTSRSISDGRSASNIISLRKTRMQELTRELLEAVIEDSNSSTASSPSSSLDNTSTSSGSAAASAAPTAVRTVLDGYKDFLLEPLEEQDAVLDPDSIYKPNMTRRQRYEAYRQEMDRRLSQARNKQAQAVLTAMKEYVLEFE